MWIGDRRNIQFPGVLDLFRQSTIMWQYENCGLAIPTHNFELAPKLDITAIHPFCKYAPKNVRLSKQIYYKFR
jgi:hypothetical protein